MTIRRRSLPGPATLALLACTPTAALAISPGPATVTLRAFTTLPDPAIDMTTSPDGRIFIAGQGAGPDAQVRLYKNGSLSTFLDLNTGGVTPITTDEQGLLAITFDPNFNAPPGTPGSGKFYTYTSEAISASRPPDFSNPELGPTSGDHDGVIREWSVDPAHPDTVDYSVPSRVIMRIRKPGPWHNGGSIKFGPDGYLYLTMGDGGGSNDAETSNLQSTTDGHSNPNGNAQTLVSSNGTTNVFGKILRIDPHDPALTPTSTDPISANGKYRVPAANPFTNAGNRTEIYAYGLRNPFRISWDPATGKLYAGDVGQSAYEEVDTITSGGNYGWVFREGAHNNSARPAPPGFTSIDPIAEYTHADGSAVVGGFVYHGNNIPALYGKYLFGDYAKAGVGRLFYMDPAGGTISALSYYTGGAPTTQIYSIAQDARGEPYVLFGNGTVSRILGEQWTAPAGGSWATAANWIGTVPNSAAGDANFLDLITSPATVTLDGSRTTGTLFFNSTIPYTISPGTGGTLTVSRSTPTPTIRVLSGSHTITAPLAVANLPQLAIAAGAALTLSGPLTGKFGVPSIDPAGKLDLTTNDLIIDYTGGTSPLPTVQSLLATGANAGTWNAAAGITTSSNVPGAALASAEAARLLNLTGTQTATWAGQTVDATTLLLKYTWSGDLNFDGVVNADDYALMDRSFARNLPPGTAQWLDGDFNYDGSLTPADYLLMDTAFGIQSGPLSPDFLALRAAQFGDAYVQDLLASIPEPASLAACGLAFLSLGRRRRSRNFDP